MSFITQILNRALRSLNLEISYRNEAQAWRATMGGALSRASENGLQPKTVIDVGAANGTIPLYQCFPEARFILIEPLREFEPALEELSKKLKTAEYLIAAAASTPGEILLNVHPDLVGSSVFKEEEDSDVNGIERIVPAVTIDGLCADRKTEPPYLIKIDTQGAELEVLKGAESVLRETELVMIEVSLFEFFKGGPQIYDCMDFMRTRGFVAYNLFDPQYRLLDGAMSQIDIAFVQEKSEFRRFQFYATPGQRAEQNRRFGVK
jgi:FkbM family methyltransferase